MLEHFLRRLKHEGLEQQQERVNQAPEEPLLDLVHGLPETDKSRLIQWTRTLRKEGLAWVHGIQFMRLAFQNVMAAQIKDYTIHPWSGISTRPKHGTNTSDRHKQSIKCQAQRVVILDEISMESTALLEALEYVVKKATRPNGTYQNKADGTTQALGGRIL